jgi:glutamate carboxypeptidase
MERGKAFGPGVIDMKSGILVGFYAIKALRDLNVSTKLPVVFILNSDEETQSHHSRNLIENESKKSKYVLCLEPRVPPGKIPTSRKSVTTLTMEITGRAAHAGAAPEKGISAIHELAHQIIELHSLTDLKRGTTVTVGVISGGRRPNVIPDNAKALIDIRVSDYDEDKRIKKAINEIQPITPGALVTISGGEERPLWAHNPQTAVLFQRTATLARQLGSEFKEVMSGGVSDANFAGALDIPTLDGLGPDGDGCHQIDEYLDLDSLVPSTVLLAELMRSLD